MAKKETNEIKEVANKPQEVLYSLKETDIDTLLKLREACDIVYKYYDNLAKASEGEYTFNNVENYKLYLSMTNTYRNTQNIIFEEIKRRVNGISK